MATQVKFGTGTNTGPSNAGSIFGLSTDEASSPLLLAPSVQHFRQDDPAGGAGATRAKMGTVLQGISAFYHLSADDRAAFTQQLENAGYLTAPTPDSKGRVKKQNPKAVDDAWATAVKDAARSGKTIIEQLTDAATAAGAATGLAAPVQNKLATNPLDVRALGNQAAQTGLGYDLSDPQQAELLAQFQSTENPYLPSTATASEPGSAGWQEWANTHVREFDPTRFDARKVLSGVDVLRQVLAGRGVTNTSGSVQ